MVGDRPPEGYPAKLLFEAKRCPGGICGICGTRLDCLLSTSLRSSLAASPAVAAPRRGSSMTVSASLSASPALELELRSLMLRWDWWNMAPEGLRGSGRAKDVLRLGMMMGSSSEEDSSYSERDSKDCSRRRGGMPRGGRPWATGTRQGSSTTTVVSARARPLASMVNLTEVRVRWAVASGMEVRLESLVWVALRGEVRPVDLELGGRLGPGIVLLVGRGGFGRIAGASVGRVCCRGGLFLLPRFSLKLRCRPGRPFALRGELAKARSGGLTGARSLELFDRRISLLAGGLERAWATLAMENWVMGSISRDVVKLVSMLDEGGRLNSKPGSTPAPGLTRKNGSSEGAVKDMEDMDVVATLLVSTRCSAAFGASGLCTFAVDCCVASSG
jgi:hypothetical protein